jgi:hypothetical protein
MKFTRLILLSMAAALPLSCQTAPPQATAEPMVTEEVRLADAIFALRDEVRSLKREMRELKKELATGEGVGRKELIQELRKEFEGEISLYLGTDMARRQFKK